MATDTCSVPKPKLIVFDLDYTLWPFWVDTHVDPPFYKNARDGIIYDSGNTKVKPYPEVPKVLARLHSEGYLLALASRTGEIEGANSLVHLLDWDKYFTYREIYPGRKTNHFKRFQECSGLPYKDMIFFDDEMRNIDDLNRIGVTSILVRDGVTEKVIEEGFRKFAENHKRRS